MKDSEESRTVFIVDDDASFLKSVSRLLRASGFEVRTFESSEAFLAQLTPELAGCVLADLRMPGIGGLELQAALAQSANPLPVVFLSAQGDIPATVQAMRQGAEDFLVKLGPKETLLAAINRALARGEREREHRKHVRELRKRFETLSPRETEVLELVLLGLMNKEIAARLGIHERTVKLHRTSLTTKLQAHSVVKLARLAAESGLFPPRQTGQID